MSEAVIKVEKLKKHFPVTKGLVFMKTIGWVKAVDDIDFTIHAGETLALVGESGCGKTTVAKLILRLLKPTAGSILFHGNNISQLSDDRLKEYRCSMQAIFQDPFSSLNPRLRVRSIIAEPIAINSTMSRDERRERVKQLLRQVGLGPQAYELYPHEFSGGERQRIALARAIALNPELVVLDEPASALDVSMMIQIMNLLKDIQQQFGIAYLLITHHLGTVRYMCHRVAVMYLGKIMEIAPVEELFTHPVHPYTQALLSAALPFHPDMQKEEIVLPGEVSNPINLPPGCRFHPRCFRAQGLCSEAEPSLNKVEPGHLVACHLDY